MRYPTNLAFGFISTGLRHICGITTIGMGYCWDPEDGDPIRVTAPVGFTSISTGGSHFCAVGGPNRGYCWGSNWNGRLGTDHGLNSNVAAATPVLGQLPPQGGSSEP